MKLQPEQNYKTCLSTCRVAIVDARTVAKSVATIHIICWATLFLGSHLWSQHMSCTVSQSICVHVSQWRKRMRLGHTDVENVIWTGVRLVKIGDLTQSLLAVESTDLQNFEFLRAWFCTQAGFVPQHEQPEQNTGKRCHLNKSRNQIQTSGNLFRSCSPLPRSSSDHSLGSNSMRFLSPSPEFDLLQFWSSQSLLWFFYNIF